jgi:hypothetical protein
MRPTATAIKQPRLQQKPRVILFDVIMYYIIFLTNLFALLVITLLLARLEGIEPPFQV